MIKIENRKIFADCIAQALKRIDANTALNTGEKMRAVNAVAKASARIENDGCFMDYDGDAERLIIWSQGSNNIYELSPNRSCFCFADQTGVICWHKAAKRLIELYNAAMLAALCSEYVSQKSRETGIPKVKVVEQINMSEIPYLKPTAQRPVEICGGIQI